MQHSDALAFAQQMHGECLGTRVARLHRQVARRFEQALLPTGLSGPQLQLLAALAVAGRPVKPSAVAAYLDIERSTMSRNLALLVRRGLLDVVERSQTGRMMAVVPTAAGLDALLSAREAWSAAQAATTEALGAGSPRALDRWLERLDEAPG